MGNTVGCASRPVTGSGGVRKVRVLLPEGNIALLDGPIDAAELMMEHLNHMVVHCSNSEPREKGARPTMIVMQPHEKLLPGQAYFVHPIPAQNGQKQTHIKPGPLSIPKHDKISKLAVQEGEDDKTQAQDDHRKKSARRRSIQRFKSRVADSTALGPDSAAAQVDEPSSDARQSVDAREPQHIEEDQSNFEDEDDYGDDIVLNLKMYMGWRPALESIPESPVGHSHPMDLPQGPPLLVV